MAVQGWEVERETKVDQTLIPGWLPPSLSSSRGFLGLEGGRRRQPDHITSDGSFPPFVLHSRLCATERRTGRPGLR
jgi:hypothetical protein